jgi:hypothetical protein
LVGFFGLGISPFAKPLSTQENTNPEESRTDIHISIRRIDFDNNNADCSDDKDNHNGIVITVIPMG